MIQGGVQVNVLPAAAVARVNCRLLPGDTLAEVVEHVRRAVADSRVQIETEDIASEASAVSEVASPEFVLLQRSLAEVFPDAVVAPGLTVGATDSRHYSAIAGQVFRFLPARVAQADLQRIHGVDERISVDNYLEMIRFYRQLLRNAAGSPGTEVEGRRGS